MLPFIPSARGIASPKSVADYMMRLSLKLAPKPTAMPKRREPAPKPTETSKPLPTNPRNRYERRKVRQYAEKLLRSVGKAA
jgi:hypothetical protein